MSTFLLCCVLGWQTPPVDRKIPPPIPQPPTLQPPESRPPDPVVTEQAPPPQQPPVQPQATVMPVRHLFLQSHDANRDGRLSPGELERRFARQFVFADLDGNGYLDPVEILHDRRHIGKAARRMEGLDLDRDSRLVFRGEKPRLPVADIARGVIDALDPNRDGFIEKREVGDAVTREILPRVMARISNGEPPPAESAPPPGALPTRPTAPPPNPNPPPTACTPPNSALPQGSAGQTGQGGVAPSVKKDELPSAEAMIANLDKDRDGKLSESEAVDQLAKNFKTIDRNRDGKLDKDEIERGLRLARLLGIKPMKPPASYKDAATKDKEPPK